MTSERAEMQDHITRVFEGMGGVGTHAELLDNAIANSRDHLNDYLVRRAWSAAVTSFFTTKVDDGLPQAPKVDATGTHMLLELMTPDEYRYAITQYLLAADASDRQAYKMARRCREIHGVDIDIAAIKMGLAS